jgi:hypothetical protein
MNRKVLLVILALCLLLPGGARTGFAQPSDILVPLLNEGWHQVSPSVLQRDMGRGKIETLGFGAEGLRFRLEEAKKQLAFLKERLRANPNWQLREAVRAYRAEVAHLTEMLDTAKAAEEISPQTKAAGIDCTIRYGAHVDAFYLTTGQGVSASADAYFNSNCGQSGEVMAHAHAEARTANGTLWTATQTDPLTGIRSGSNVSASAGVTLNGVTNCYSYASSSMTSYDLGIVYTQSMSNNLCPPPVLNLSVYSNYGPSVDVWGYGCALVTWIATASGGAPPYSYQWYVGFSQVGSGSTYSQWFCGSNWEYAEDFTVTAVATDSSSPAQSKSVSDSITIYYHREQPCDPRFPCELQ